MLKKAVLLYRIMRSYFVKFFFVLSFILLFYFIGIQGCSPTLYLGGLETVTCEEFPERFGCNVERVEGPVPEEEEAPFPPIEGEETPIRERERTSPREREGTSPRERERTSPREREGTSPRERRPVKPRKNYLKFEYTIPSGKVDILFVIDNSSSMAKEHRNLAGQFVSFLHNLKHVDYHIAVITTDISASPQNPVQGAYYQDGKFIPVGRRIFLKNENIGQRISQRTLADFKNAVVREETTRCDQSNQPRSSSRNKYDFDENPSSIICPSHDERGTYAVNLAIRNPMHEAFFRPDAHLILVFLSDEDIRSGEEYIEQPGFEEYAFESFDYPEVLMESIYNRFGPLKSVSAYPIIVPPEDSKCLRKQNAKKGQGEGTGRGYYGKEYARLAKARVRDSSLTQYGNLLKGKVISICRRNYSAQLNQVAVAANTVRMPLPCGNPDRIEMYVDGQKEHPRHSVEGRTLIVEPGNIRLGADTTLRVRCPE